MAYSSRAPLALERMAYGKFIPLERMNERAIGRGVNDVNELYAVG